MATGTDPKATRYLHSTASRFPVSPFMCLLWPCAPPDQGSHHGATGAVAQGQPEMPLSWEDEIPPPCPLHDITGAAGAGKTVQETFITPSFVKLAIIPMISIVRIYYKDITTISDSCHSPALMDGHNYHPVSLVPLSLQVL